MKIWVKRALVLLILAALAPAARWSERMLSNLFGAGDGEITRFAINHAVAALPTLIGFLIVSLCLWWLRERLSNKKVMLSLCTLLMVFGILNFAAEILIVTRPRPNGDDHEHRVPHPFIEFKGSFQSGKHNSLGYGGKIPEQKKQGEYRIIFLGGSTVRFGEPAIPERVEQLFHADNFKEVQVFNFGVSGSNTGMELARLVFEALAYQPDLIVSYSGANDIILPLSADPRPGYPFNFMIREYNPLLDKDYPLATLTAYGSYLMRVIGHEYFQKKFIRAEALRRSSGWTTQAWREQIADVYIHNLETSARIANAFDSAFVAFLQPTLMTKKNLTELERRILDMTMKNSERKFGLTSADWYLHDEVIRSRIKEHLSATRKPEFHFIDMSAVFDGVEPSVYLDNIHTEQHARDLVAQEIFETLRPLRAAKLR